MLPLLAVAAALAHRGGAPTPLPACRVNPCADICAALFRGGMACADVDLVAGGVCGCSACCDRSAPRAEPAASAASHGDGGAGKDGAKDNSRRAVEGTIGSWWQDLRQLRIRALLQNAFGAWREYLRQQQRDHPLALTLFTLVPLLARLVGDALLELSFRLLGYVCCSGRRPPGVDVDAAWSRQYEWGIATERAGMSPRGARFLALSKVLVWHLAQPVAYFSLVAATWDQLGRGLRVECIMLMAREAAYALLALSAAAMQPACLLASPWARESGSTTAFANLLYIFAPGSFLGLVLVRGDYGWATFFAMLPFDTVGVIAFSTACHTGAPAALVVALGAIGAALLPFPLAAIAEIVAPSSVGRTMH